MGLNPNILKIGQKLAVLEDFCPSVGEITEFAEFEGKKPKNSQFLPDFQNSCFGRCSDQFLGLKMKFEQFYQTFGGKFCQKTPILAYYFFPHSRVFPQRISRGKFPAFAFPASRGKAGNVQLYCSSRTSRTSRGNKTPGPFSPKMRAGPPLLHVSI